jgi:hypothetical protein
MLQIYILDLSRLVKFNIIVEQFLCNYQMKINKISNRCYYYDGVGLVLSHKQCCIKNYQTKYIINFTNQK